MNNHYEELTDDTLCIICFEKVNSEDKISNFCSSCNITMHYDCLYQWCISSNDNKCPICLTPIKKIIDIVDNTNNYDHRLELLNSRLQCKMICFGLSLFFTFIYFLRNYS